MLSTSYRRLQYICLQEEPKNWGSEEQQFKLNKIIFSSSLQTLSKTSKPGNQIISSAGKVVLDSLARTELLRTTAKLSQLAFPLLI